MKINKLFTLTIVSIFLFQLVSSQTLQTTTSCDKWLQKETGISYPPKGSVGMWEESKAMFNWQYSKSQTRCILNLRSIKQPKGMGCKIEYSIGYCPTLFSMDYPNNCENFYKIENFHYWSTAKDPYKFIWIVPLDNQYRFENFRCIIGISQLENGNCKIHWNQCKSIKPPKGYA